MGRHLERISARVTPDAAAAFRRFAALHSLSVSAVLQAIGEQLADVLAAGGGTIDVDRLIDRAGEVADERFERE